MRGRVALVGDAAHAIVPFFGQGANCAFEDCVELDRSLTATGGDWPSALARYEAHRKANADAIADMALANFVEMSEKVASPVFRGQTRVRHALERALGGRLRLALRAGVVHDDPVRRDRGPDPAPGPDGRRGRGRGARGGGRGGAADEEETMTEIGEPVGFDGWIEENRHLLRPPVGNKQLNPGAQDLIVMVVGGPNQRQDYHVDPYEEWFYQIKGNMHVNVIDDGRPRTVHIREGETWLLPGGMPHSPQRPEEGSIGLVVEQVRKPGTLEKFQWYAHTADTATLVHEVELQVTRHRGGPAPGVRGVLRAAAGPAPPGWLGRHAGGAVPGALVSG